jgi:hypothetical protein
LEKIQGLGAHLGALRIDPGDGGEHFQVLSIIAVRTAGRPVPHPVRLAGVSASRRRVAFGLRPCPNEGGAEGFAI